MRKHRRAALWLVLAPPAAFLLTLLFGSFYLRHRPLRLPPEVRYPQEPGKRAATLRWGGIAGYEVDDGRTVILVDPTVTRPTLVGLFLGRFEPDEELAADVYPRADYILVKHAHYDHAADVPSIALRTGATVVGTRSTVNLARSRGVPADKTILVEPGDELTLGGFKVLVRAYEHSKVLGIEDFMSGTIPEGAGKLWWWRYTMDGSLSYRLDDGKVSFWFAGPSTFEDGAPPAANLVMGIAGHVYDAQRMKRILDEAKPQRLFPAHYDNFFQPLSRGLNRLPVVDVEAIARMIRDAAPGLPLYFLDHGEKVEIPPDAG